MRFKFNTLIFILSFLLFSKISSAQDAYQITLKIKDYKEKVCYLANYYGDKKYIKDTCRLEKIGDPIVFHGKEKLHEGIFLVVLPSMKYFEIIVGANQKFEIETDTTDFVGRMKIKNSTDNQLFLDYLKYTAKKGGEIEQLSAKYKIQKNKKDSLNVLHEMQMLDSSITAYRKNYAEKNPKTLLASVFKAMPEPIVPKGLVQPQSYYYFKNHYFDNVDFSDERLLYTPIFQAKVDKYLNQLTPQHPDSISISTDILVKKSKANKEMFKWMVWYLANTYEQSKIMGMDAVFVHVAKEYYCKGEAFWIDSAKLKKICERADHLAKINIGAKVPNMILEDSSLRSSYLYDLMAKDNYTILWFWNSNCGHCQKETPELYKVYEEIHDKDNVGVITITEERLNTKDDPEMKRWKKYLSDHPMKWYNLRDANNYYDFKDMFDVYATPKMFIIDSKTHEILAKQLSVEQIKEVIEQIKKSDDAEKKKSGK